MARKVLLLIAPLLLLLQVCGLAQVYGLLHPASSFRRGQSEVGGYLMLLGDGGLDFGVLAKGRLGLGGGGEVGGKLGLLGDGHIGLLLGADYKHQFLRQTREIPLNLAGDWAFLMRAWDDHFYWALNSTCIVDHLIDLEQGKSLNPYGGLTLSINYFTNRVDDLDLDLCLNLGMVFRVTEVLSFVGEIEVGDDAGLGMGVSFRL